MTKQDKIMGEAIILGVQSILSYREYENKQQVFNQYIKKHKGLK